MRAVRVERQSAQADDLTGRVLCHELRSGDGRVAIAKGRVLDLDDTARALSLEWTELHLLALDDRDVHEEVAGTRIAQLAAGEGVAVRAATGGHWPLVAMHRGVLAIDTALLQQVNELEGPCVYSLYDHQIVEAGDVVARAKLIPFAVASEVLVQVEAIAQPSGGIVHVHAFAPHRIGAVVHESLGERAVARFREAVVEKVAWFGSTVCSLETVPPSGDVIVGAFERARDAGAQIILVAGTKAMDLLDPTFVALQRVGAQMERQGVPAHPGSLLWIARWNTVPVIGMPTCGLFAQATVFDLVIARMLAGEPVGRRELASLAHGGFLTRDMAFRLPAYRAAGERGTVE